MDKTCFRLLVCNGCSYYTDSLAASIGHLVIYLPSPAAVTTAPQTASSTPLVGHYAAEAAAAAAVGGVLPVAALVSGSRGTHSFRTPPGIRIARILCPHLLQPRRLARRPGKPASSTVTANANRSSNPAAVNHLETTGSDTVTFQELRNAGGLWSSFSLFCMPITPGSCFLAHWSLVRP